MNRKEPAIPEEADTTAWHNLSVPEVLKRLNANLRSGLTSKEAAHRLDRFGPNVLKETGVIP